MKQLYRELQKEVERMAPGAKIEQLRQRTHRILQITYNDQTVQISCASSPKNVDHAVRNSCTEIRKKLNLPKATTCS